MAKNNLIDLFLELANPNIETGESRWVYTSEFVSIKVLCLAMVGAGVENLLAFSANIKLKSKERVQEMPLLPFD